MANQHRRSILCPNCGRLVSVDESPCPYCGLRNPGSRWKSALQVKGLLREDRFVQNVIILNGAMFILSIVLSPTSIGMSMNPFGFLSPGTQSLLLLGASGRVPIEQLHRWWSVLTANYLHAGILHILFNMMAFRQLAPLILQEYGLYRTAAIYTLGGVLGYVVSYFAGVRFTLGASAAVCGLIGAALYYGKSRGGYFGQAVYSQVGGWAVGILLFGLFFPGINNWAHGGGFLGGILTGFLLGYRDRAPENYFHRALAGLCVLATLAALLWAVATAFIILLAGPDS